jgi:hypothetical protein
MTGIAAIVFAVVLVVQFVGTIGYLLLIASLFRRLKASHTTVWESLGSPSLIMNNSPRNNLRVLRWLWAKGYLDLGDSETVDLAGTVRTLLLALLGNFAILVLLILAMGPAGAGRIH